MPATSFVPAVAIALAACRRSIRMAAAVGALVSSSLAMAQTLTVAVARTPLSLPVYIAHEKGYFAEEGLDVRLHDCTGGHRCLKLVLDGQADLATASDLPIVFNAFERADYAVIATLVTSREDNKLIAHARSGVSRPMHLAGKRIGAVPGSSSQYFLETDLLTLGMDPAQQSVVALQPEDMVEALRGGKVDAIAVWEPYAYLATRALGRDAVVLPTSGGYVLTFNLISHRRHVGGRDGDLTHLLRAVERAERFIQARPDEAKAILRSRLQLDQAFIDWVWGGMSFRLGLDQALITTMEGEARWARRSGHVTTRSSPNFLSLLHTAPLNAAKPGSVGVTR